MFEPISPPTRAHLKYCGGAHAPETAFFVFMTTSRHNYNAYIWDRHVATHNIVHAHVRGHFNNESGGEKTEERKQAKKKHVSIMRVEKKQKNTKRA